MKLETRSHSIASLRAVIALVVTAVIVTAGRAEAQSLGTFTWQLQPFCNLVTVNVIQQGAVYTLDGYDDQCGGVQRAPVVGLATPNPDGTIGLGFNVTVPGAAVQIGGRIALGGLGGPWTDSAGNSGHFAFGANTGGNPRPVPSASLLADGGFLASGAVSMTPVPASGPGTRMMWHPGKSAFRVGTVNAVAWDDANVGLYSIAMGHSTKASGAVSTALGNGTTASGQSSTALGAFTTASGHKSTAMGDSTTASGPSSTAFGIDTTASGQSSTAFGDLTTASGSHSVALGLRSTAAGAHAFAMGDGSSAGGGNSVAFGASPRALGFESVSMGLRTTAAGNGSVALGSDASAGTGTFAFGDRSTNNVLASPFSNQFLVRAAGGVILYTNAAMTSGVQVSAGGSGWSVVSDVSMKEHFRDVTPDDVLARLARMPVREWSYKTQDSSIRHMGPTAQDFRAAFGLGESDVRINTIDADGVALAAVKALEARTRDLSRENDELRARLTHLEALIEKR